MIRLKNIYKNYGENEILKDINLSINAGEFCILLGKSGSGKSTLLNIIGLIDDATSGEYIFNTTHINKLNANEKSCFRALNFGFIFQRYNLLPALSVMQNILLATRYYKFQDASKKALNLCKQLDILELKDRLCAHLSGGQQQRVSVARALLNDANFILADEPTGALDSANAKALMDELKRLNQSGVGVILVTHDESLRPYASRIISLQDGRIISDERNIEQKPCELKTSKLDKLSLIASLKAHAKDALKNIFAHKLRSALSMLGIIIATCAIVCTIALGNGAKASVLKEISFLGNNTIIIQTGSRAGDTEANLLKELEFADIKLLKTLPFIADVGVRSMLPNAIAYANFKSTLIDASGVFSNFLRIKNKKIIYGRFISDLENERAASVGVLSFSAAKALFKDPALAINKIILLNNVAIKVIGVIEPDRQSDGLDLEIYLSANTLALRFSGDFKIHRLYVVLNELADNKVAERIIKSTLELKKGPNSIITYNLDAIKKTIENTANKLSALIFGVAAVAMVVGGIGIMNIMLVAIKERTKEIGIKLAIGASANAISLGFLIESLLISLLGSLLGALIATALCFGLDLLGVDMPLSLGAYLLGFLLSSICGLVFGYFPANKAKKLSPAQCLSDL